MTTDSVPRPSRPIEKVSIIISKGSLDGIYPGLIMANGARMPRASRPTCSSRSSASTPSTSERHEHIKVATVGNPGLHLPTLARRPPRHVRAHDALHGAARWRSSTSRRSPSSSR